MRGRQRRQQQGGRRRRRAVWDGADGVADAGGDRAIDREVREAYSQDRPSNEAAGIDIPRVPTKAVGHHAAAGILRGIIFELSSRAVLRRLGREAMRIGKFEHKNAVGDGLRIGRGMLREELRLGRDQRLPRRHAGR